VRGFQVRGLLGLNASRRSERVARALLASAVAGCAALVMVDFVVGPLSGHFLGWFEDFGPIRYAGHAANSGGDIYGGFAPGARSSLVTDLGFDYPPLVAFLVRPLAAMPYRVAATIWLWTLLSATIYACIVVAGEVLPATWPRPAIGFCVAILFAPAAYNLWHGNLNALVFLSLALALRAWVRGDEIGCGVALALGGAAKVAPAVLLILLLRRRWWRGLAVGSATLGASLIAGGALVGFDRLREWFTVVLPALGRGDGWYFNQGWSALLNRLAGHSVWRLDPPSPALQAATLLLGVGGLLSIAWLARRNAASPERRSVEFGAGVVAMLLAGTITWYSTYEHLAIPLLIVVGLAARRGTGRALAAAAAGSAAAAGIAVPLFLAGGGKDWLTGTHGTWLWWPALQLASLPAISAAGLLGVLLIRLARWDTWPPRAVVLGV
jgi:hypothetical protein